MKLTVRDIILELKIKAASKAIIFLMEIGAKKLAWRALVVFMRLRNYRRPELIHALECARLNAAMGNK